MRFLNLLANKFFALLFSWLLGQQVRDTLCGTKVLYRADYERIAANRAYFGDFDPFGDFDLLFGAARLNLRIVDLAVRYHERTYGETNISRFRHGWLLLAHEPVRGPQAEVPVSRRRPPRARDRVPPPDRRPRGDRLELGQPVRPPARRAAGRDLRARRRPAAGAARARARLRHGRLPGGGRHQRRAPSRPRPVGRPARPGARARGRGAATVRLVPAATPSRCPSATAASTPSTAARSSTT